MGYADAKSGIVVYNVEPVRTNVEVRMCSLSISIIRAPLCVIL